MTIRVGFTKLKKKQLFYLKYSKPQFFNIKYQYKEVLAVLNIRNDQKKTNTVGLAFNILSRLAVICFV